MSEQLINVPNVPNGDFVAAQHLIALLAALERAEVEL